MKKKVCSLLLCGMMTALMLSGCGNAEQTETSGDSNGASTSQVEEQQDQADQDENDEEQQNNAEETEEPTEQNVPEEKRVLKKAVKKDINGAVAEECEYDTQGNPVKEIYYEVELIRDEEYVVESEYDAQGNLVKQRYLYEEEWRADEEHTYEYDAEGNRTVHIVAFAQETESTQEMESVQATEGAQETAGAQEDFTESYREEYEYEYDDQGNIAVKHINLVGDCMSLYRTSRIEYVYDAEGRITEETYYTVPAQDGAISYDEILDHRMEYEYDEQGNLLVERFCDERGETVAEKDAREYSIQYEYDESGNMISEYGSGSVSEITNGSRAGSYSYVIENEFY